MPAKSPAAAAIPRTYAELRHGVSAVLLAGRRQVEEAWVRTYHETGRLLHALPHCEMDEKLRLRGRDCPEMATPEGRAAKRYVEGLLG